MPLIQPPQRARFPWPIRQGWDQGFYSCYLVTTPPHNKWRDTATGLPLRWEGTQGCLSNKSLLQVNGSLWCHNFQPHLKKQSSLSPVRGNSYPSCNGWSGKSPCYCNNGIKVAGDQHSFPCPSQAACVPGPLSPCVSQAHAAAALPSLLLQAAQSKQGRQCSGNRQLTSSCTELGSLQTGTELMSWRDFGKDMPIMGANRHLL